MFWRSFARYEVNASSEARPVQPSISSPMKTPIARLALASVVGISSLFAAEVVGLLPPLPIGPEFLVGGYVAGGLLVLLVRDYGRGPAHRQTRRPRVGAARPATSPARPLRVFGWEHHTFSA